MDSKGVITAVFFSLEKGRASKFTQQAILMGNFGMQGDRHRMENVDNQLLLVNHDVLRDLNLAPGAIKENLTVRGLDLDALPAGTRLQIGEIALIELTGPCAPCKLLEKVRTGLMKEILGRRGMYAKVIRGGVVRIDDAVKVVKSEAVQSDPGS